MPEIRQPVTHSGTRVEHLSRPPSFPTDWKPYRWRGLPFEYAPYRDETRPITHGTNNGYHAHVGRGEAACGECKEAHAKHNLEGK